MAQFQEQRQRLTLQVVCAPVQAVAKFPSHSGKCTPEQEAEWRSRPAFARSLAEARAHALDGYSKL
jgi:hypothetical protein